MIGLDAIPRRWRVVAAAAAALLLNLGFRVSVSLRTGMHVGKVWRMPIRESDVANGPMALNLSDAIVVASRTRGGSNSHGASRRRRAS